MRRQGVNFLGVVNKFSVFWLLVLSEGVLCQCSIINFLGVVDKLALLCVKH